MLDAGKVIINPGGSWPALLPALLGSRARCPPACRGSPSRGPALLRPGPAAPQAVSGSRGCLPGGERDRSKQLNFSLRFTDRFPEILERGEGIGSKICRGTSLAFFNSAAELVNKVAGSQPLFLFLASSFFFFSFLNINTLGRFLFFLV